MRCPLSVQRDVELYWLYGVCLLGATFSLPCNVAATYFDLIIFRLKADLKTKKIERGPVAADVQASESNSTTKPKASQGKKKVAVDDEASNLSQITKDEHDDDEEDEEDEDDEEKDSDDEEGDEEDAAEDDNEEEDSEDTDVSHKDILFCHRVNSNERKMAGGGVVVA